MSSHGDNSPSNSSSNNGDSTQTPVNEGDSRPESSGATQSGVGLFERLMDTVLGLQHRNSDGGSTTRNGNSSLETANLLSQTQPNSDNENTRGTPTSGVFEWTFPSGFENTGGTTNMQFATINNDNQAVGTENLDLNSNLNSDATVSAPGVSGSDADSRGIVITVNYVFSDENDPLHPNRSGSLVMSLPNNSSNRDPEFIQQLIRFATQMAYSSIVNGLQREKRLTQENFNSLPKVDYDKLGESKTCSICFEDMEDHKNLEKKEEDDEEEEEEDDDDDDRRHIKRRKMNDNSASPSPFSSQQPSAASTPPPTTTEEIAKRPLAEYTGTYDHIPIELPCHHIFGQSCLREWLKDHITCPLCRKPVIEPTEDNNVSPNRNLTILTLPNTLNTNDADANTTTTTSRLRRILRPASMNADERNPATENAISHILGYLRRQRNEAPSNDPLFPSGVSSRRTDNGVDTTLTSSSSSNGETNNDGNIRHENTTGDSETNQSLQVHSENTLTNNDALGTSSQHPSTNNQSNDEHRPSDEN